MNFLPRILYNRLKNSLYKGKVLVLYGARRTGKTTLVRQLVEEAGEDAAYINCELQENKDLLQSTNSLMLKDFVAANRLMVFDEAQHIPDMGIILKVLVDTFPEVQFIATGSSSFELASKVSEPLTGRSRTYMLLPFSLEEMRSLHPLVELKSMLPSFIRFGMYPQVVFSSEADKEEELSEIASSYLYRDVLQFEQIKRPELIEKLLQALALQLGSKSSLNELAQITGSNVHTVKRYIELLEKSFVIFRLRSFSRNLRKEIAKSQKIYFYDTGIRNAIIRNHNPLHLRSDAGGLWENFCISERLKFNEFNRRKVNSFFWRTYDQKEIDYIEEKDGALYCFEFKYNSKASGRMPKEFAQTYPEARFKTITPENFYELFSEDF